MVRLFGPRAARMVLRRLKLVWISHLHADHHLGLARLVCAATALRAPHAPPLLVIGPRGIGQWLDAYAALLPRADGGAPTAAVRWRFRSCREANSARCVERQWLLRESGLGLTGLQSIPVEHCADAWGLVLSHRSGWSVCYSGDTRPCAALARAGRGATLLLHEATFADEMAADAAKKRHSTHGEAREVARRMGAYRTLLTHLSARYDAGERRESHRPADDAGGAAAAARGEDPARFDAHGAALLPAIEALARGDGAACAVAFDLMVLNLRDLPALPACTPRLARFFRGAHERAEREREAALAAQLARSRRLEEELAERRRGTGSGGSVPDA